MKNLLTVAIRQSAIFVPDNKQMTATKAITGSTAALAANLASLGYVFSEDLLHALNASSPTFKLDVLNAFKSVMGVQKNWTPLVKGWDVPTNESVVDHIMTFFANVLKAKGTTLACGHIIPANTFPLERYNGCPFCGTPFVFGEIEKYGQGSKKKVLELWTQADANAFFKDLLASKTALDATQLDSLKCLLQALPFPEVAIGMKETQVAVVDFWIEQNQAEKACALFKSPTDIMRYLWYKHTGFLQIIEPKTIIKRHAKNNRHLNAFFDKKAGKAKFEKTAELKLKYTRKDCYRVAKWLNALEMPVDKIAEIMHPKRSMWVRFIRALRLAEYAKKAEFVKLSLILDVFYNEKYENWQARVNHFRLRSDEAATFSLLKQRPGLFARSLFSNMLWFGADTSIEAFKSVVDQVPARLVFTLNMYAQNYFNKGQMRTVKPLGGVAKSIESHPLLDLYDFDELDRMKSSVEELTLFAMRKRFSNLKNTNYTMYIDPALFNIPVSIGDRSDNVQDMPSALMGTKFPLEGNALRLFMQWGTGLPAQHLDMDLSCHIAYSTASDICSYAQLTPFGCKHSGDIRSIPDKIGTAEYIEIDVKKLREAKAKYVTFTCNAYSNGAITPNLVLGWMDSKFPMHISESSGVAYDPSCVQHQVRITHSLAKGMVFGVLDVEAHEIVWLEMPFQGQVVQQLDMNGVKALLAKLKSKLSVGNLLTLKAEAQGLHITGTADADEVYTTKWAANSAAVTQLLLD